MLAAEQKALPGRQDLAVAVARNLHKLMAYKDEYEVARLLLADGTAAERRSLFGEHGRVTWNLQPALLRRLGVRRKLRLGPWFAPVLRLLRAGRHLRGTGLDLLGRHPLRQAERQLIDDYRAMIETALATLTPASHPTAVTLAGLPDLIRGYEDVKAASIRAYYARVAEIRQQPKPVPVAQAAASQSNSMEPPPHHRSSSHRSPSWPAQADRPRLWLRGAQAVGRSRSLKTLYYTNGQKHRLSPVILGQGRGSTPCLRGAAPKAWMVGLPPTMTA